MNGQPAARLTAALAGSCLLLSACGGSSGSAAAGAAAPAPTRSAGQVSSCALLTTAEVESALGSPVRPPQGSTGPLAGGTADSCVFRSKTVTGEAFNVFLYSPYDAARFAGHYRAADGYRRIRGVGDMAVTLRQRTEIDVLKGDVLLTVSFSRLRDGTAEIAPRSELRRLGQEAASRLSRR